MNRKVKIDLNQQKQPKLQLTFHKGGSGSGHRGHSGRPGKRGGSMPGSGGGGVIPEYMAPIEREMVKIFTSYPPKSDEVDEHIRDYVKDSQVESAMNKWGNRESIPQSELSGMKEESEDWYDMRALFDAGLYITDGVTYWRTTLGTAVQKKLK